MEVHLEQVSQMAACVLPLLVALHYLRHTPEELRRLRETYRRSVATTVGRFCRTRRALSLIVAVLFGMAALACPILYLYHTVEVLLGAATAVA